MEIFSGLVWLLVELGLIALGTWGVLNLNPYAALMGLGGAIGWPMLFKK